MMTLFIDTADKDLIVGLFNDKQTVKLNHYTNDVTLSSRLVPIVKNTIEESNVDKNNINKIIVVNGPGSFTGARMGVVVAKTYAWALNKKIVPVSKLELIATTNVDTKYVLSLIDARHDFVYAGIYDNNLNNIVKDKYISSEEINTLIKQYNDITIVTEDNFSFETIKPIFNFIKLIDKYKDNDGINPHKVNPNYLKNTEAEDNLGKKND